MSKFSKFQETECAAIVEPTVPAPICPDCKPNEAYIEPSLFDDNLPNYYYNEKTCEYVVVFYADMSISKLSEKYGSYKSYLKNHKRKGVGKKGIEGSNVQFGIRLLLSHHSKIQLDRFICMFPNCDDSSAGNEVNQNALELFSTISLQVDGLGDSTPLIKVSVPKTQFEAVPPSPEDTDQDLAGDGIDEIEFKTEEIYGMFLRLQLALRVFTGFYKVFMTVDRGYLHFEDSPFTPIGPNRFYTAYTRLKEFRQTLKNIITDKGYIYGVFINLPLKKKVQKIKIKFDNSDPKYLYTVKSIHVKPSGCRWRKVHTEKEGNRKFTRFTKNQINVNAYVADLYNIDDDIQAAEPPPWHEFLVNHTISPLHINYSNNADTSANPESSLGCAIDKWFNLADIVDNIADSFEDIFELYAYIGNKKACADFEDQKEDQEYWTWEEAKAFEGPWEITKADDDLKSKTSLSPTKQSAEADALEEEARQAVKDDKRSRALKGAERKEERYDRKDPDSNSEKFERKRNKVNRQRGRKAKRIGSREYKSATIMRMAKMRAMQEFEQDETVFQSLREMVKGGSEYADDAKEYGWGTQLAYTSAVTVLNKEWWLDLLAKMSVCEVSSLAKNVFRCLMGGLPFDKALPKIMQAMMKSLSVRHLPKLMEGLSLEQQLEVQRKVEKVIGKDTPGPWEKSWNSGNDANQKLSSYGISAYVKQQPAKEAAKIAEEIKSLVDGHQRLHSRYRELHALKTQKVDLCPAGGNDLGDFCGLTKQERQQLINEDSALLNELVNYWRQYDKDNLVAVKISGREESINVEYAYEIAATGKGIEFDKPIPDPKQASEESSDEASQKKKGEFDKANRGIKIDTGDSVIYGWGLSEDQQEQAQFGGKLSDATNIILQAYVDAILETVEIDDLLKHLNRFPVASLLKDVLISTLGYCPNPNAPFSSDITGILKMNIDVCDPTFAICLPKIPKIRLFDPGKFIGERLREAFKEVMVMLIAQLLLKLLNLLEGVLCQGLAALGDLGLNGILGNNSNLEDLLANTLCGPDAGSIGEILDDIMDNMGILPDDIKGNGDCVAATMTVTLSQKEMLNTFSGREKDPAMLSRVSRAISLACPNMAPYFDDPSKVADFLDDVRNLIPTEQQEIMRDVADQAEDCPVLNSICLTNEQFDNWNQLRKDILEDFGLPADEAAEQIENLNENALDALGEVADLLSEGTDGLINKAVSEMYKDPLSHLPGCETNAPTAILNQPEEYKNASDTLSSYMFSQIERSYKIDMTAGRKSVLNMILSDTEGKSFKTHLRRRSNFISKTFYWDSLEQEQADESLLDFDFFKSRGYYPLTIAASLRHQIIDDEGNFKTNKKIEDGYAHRYDEGFFGNRMIYQENYLPNKKPDATLKWTSTEEEPIVKKTMFLAQNTELAEEYKFPTPKVQRLSGLSGLFDEPKPKTIKGSKFKLKDNFDYSIRASQEEESGTIVDELFDVSVSVNVDADTAELIENLQIDTSALPYRVRVFNKFFESKVGISTFNLTDSSLFDKVYSNVFKFSKNALISNLSDPELNLKGLTKLEDVDAAEEITREDLADDDYLANFKDFANESSQGFLFGMKTDKLTTDDFEYVGPNGEEYTYSNREKILGKSATGNPRVTFLNPEIHGGRYVRPKIYVKPLELEGWSKIYKLFASPNSLCGEEVEDTLIGFGELKERIKDLKRNLNEDKRLYQDPECVKEIPFDKLLGKETHAHMDVVVRLLIRVYSLGVFIQIMPILANLNLGQGNFDNFLSHFILSLMKEEMSSLPRKRSWYKVASYKYWFLFLEQTCQAFIREVDLGERTITELEKNVVDRIKVAQAFYQYPTDEIVTEIAEVHLDTVLFGAYAGAVVGSSIPIVGTAVGGIAGAVIAADASAKQSITLKGRKITLADLAGDDKLPLEEFYLYALAYREHQDKIFSSTNELELKIKKNWINRKRLQDAARIFLIRIMESEALILVSSFMNKELGEFSKNFSNEIEPNIYNFKKMMLSRTEMFKGTKLNLGTYAVEKQRSANLVINPGDVADVVSDPRQDNPLDNTKLDDLISEFPEMKKNGQFIIEKYIRVKDKEPKIDRMQALNRKIPATNATLEALKSRSDLLKGVVPIKDFESFLATVPDDPLNPDRDNLISDCFGDLQLTYDNLSEDPNGITGEIGLSYGIRICYMPPASMTSKFANLNFDNDLILKEKSFKFPPLGVLSDQGEDASMTRFIIPLASAEIQLIDEPLSQFLSTKSVNELDLECLVDKLITTPEFKLLFDNCVSLPAMNSYVTAHVYSCFLGAIGQADGWARADGGDPDDSFEEWDPASILKQSKRNLRRLFASLYTSNDFEDDETSRGVGLGSFGSLLKLMNPFNPRRFLGSILGRWKLRRIVIDNPFNEDGEECSASLDELFN